MLQKHGVLHLIPIHQQSLIQLGVLLMPKTVPNDYYRDAVVTAFTASPHKSTRRASCELQISATSIRRILHDIGMKP